MTYRDKLKMYASLVECQAAEFRYQSGPMSPNSVHYHVGQLRLVADQIDEFANKMELNGYPCHEKSEQFAEDSS